MLRSWTIEDSHDMSQCWRLFVKGTKFIATADEAGNLPGDEALLLGCHILIKTYTTTSKNLSKFNSSSENPKFLFQAALCLQAGLQLSKNNFQFKLLLIRILLFLGTSSLQLSDRRRGTSSSNGLSGPWHQTNTIRHSHTFHIHPNINIIT